MAWGARNVDGWRLCERKGKTIVTVCAKRYPGVEIKFSSQAKAKACADEMNERFWKEYVAQIKENEIVETDLAGEMLAVVRAHGGLSDEDYRKCTAS